MEPHGTESAASTASDHDRPQTLAAVDLGNALLVCPTETKTDADIETYVDAMRDVFKAPSA